jgi:hypothetical protein
MNNIKWEDGAVCYAAKKQWNSILQYDVIIDLADFQLNEIRTGDYIKPSELDTEQKYNEAVEVFGLFGFNHLYTFGEISELAANLTVCNDGKLYPKSDSSKDCQRKVTHSQLMAIGKLKRAMIERDKSNLPEIPDSSKRNKSKQAYEILKSLDYDYDLVKQRWFKKEYI